MASEIRGLVFMFVTLLAVFVFPGTEATYTCPAGWKLYMGDQTCLKIYTGRTTWTLAQIVCVGQFPGSLVIIRDKHKNRFVNAMTPKGKEIWIGIRKYTPSAMSLAYTDLSKPGSYQPIINQSPKIFQDCLSLSPGTKDGSWYYRKCLSSLSYMCQIPATNNGITEDVSTNSPRFVDSRLKNNGNE